MPTDLPNLLTLSRIVAIPLMVLLVAFRQPWADMAACVVFSVAAITDYFDGKIARDRGFTSSFGRMLDPIADKLLVGAAFIMMTYNGMLNPILCIIFVGREIIVSGFRLVTANSGKVIAANWLGKLKSALQVVAILATLLGNPVFSRWDFPFDFGLMYTAAVFTVWSAVDYIVANRKSVNWN